MGLTARHKGLENARPLRMQSAVETSSLLDPMASTELRIKSYVRINYLARLPKSGGEYAIGIGTN